MYKIAGLGTLLSEVMRRVCVVRSEGVPPACAQNRVTCKEYESVSKVTSVMVTRKDWKIVIARAKPEAISNGPKPRLLRRSGPRNDMIGSFECGRES